MADQQHDLRDWRGTPILPNRPCVYAANSGNHTATVEGVTCIIDGSLTTRGGRVWVKILRRSHGGGKAGTPLLAHVTPERLTMLGQYLPASPVPFESSLILADQKQIQERKRVEATHDIENYGVSAQVRYCTRCDIAGPELAEKECPDADHPEDDEIISAEALAEMFTSDQLTAMGLL